MFFSNKKLSFFKKSHTCQKKLGFTMIEVIIVAVVVSIGLLGIITTVNYAKGASDKVRRQVVASNIAREGMESMYSIRDSNWQRWGIKKDKCWLNIDPIKDSGLGCENEPWIIKDKYILVSKGDNVNQYFTLNSTTGLNLNLVDPHNVEQNKYFLMCRDTTYKNRYNCPNDQAKANLTRSQGFYYRQIEVQDLVNKQTNISIALTCTNGAACSDTNPKELRFCTKVEYQADSIGSVNLCGVLTNFLK